MAPKKNQLTLASNDFKEYMRKSAVMARALRDEVRVQLRLGTSEAKARLAEIEKGLTHVDTLAHELNHAMGQLVDRLIDDAKGAAEKRGVARTAKARKAKAGARR
jgi:hypothetical protein